MNTNEHKLRTLITDGEGISTEFKACRGQLPKSVYETVCAFLNRHGGTVLLGVEDSGKVPGIATGIVEQLKKDFVTAINNPQKLQPPAYRSVDKVVLDGKTLLHVYVPESSQVHRCNGRIYDRYDDRDLVRTNLIDTYDRIMAFIRKHLPDPFYLEGDERRSLRDAIFREVASNLIIHREYASGVPARLVIEHGKVTTDNANRPHGFGALDPDTFAPYPKNPVIGAFFREIDRADELGSGMRNMMKYGKKYGGTDPQLVEGDVFRMIISIPQAGELGDKTSEKTSEKILRAVRGNPGITIAELAVSIGVSTRSVERNIRKLQNGGQLTRVGSDKGGHWEVLD